MTTISRTLMTFAAVMSVTTAFAQPGPGMGSSGMGDPGSGWKGWAWDGNTVPGWQMMTTDERAEHQHKMRNMKTVDDCEVYHKEHRQLMEQRAKDKGVTLAMPQRDPCEMMKARGIIK